MWHEPAHSMNSPQRFAGAIAFSVPIRFAGYMPSNALNEGAGTAPSHRHLHTLQQFNTFLPVSAKDDPAQRESDPAPFKVAARKAKGMTQPF